MARRERRVPMGDNVTSVTELADRLYAYGKNNAKKAYRKAAQDTDFDEYDTVVIATTISRVCANAADAMIPLSVVKQLLKGTDYEQLI